MDRLFKKIADIGVARYTGQGAPRSKFSRQLLGLFSAEVKIDTDEGHFTNSFDWDGSTIWTSCDCELAINEWSAKSSEHLKRIVGDNNNYSTLYTYRCGWGVVFGNGYNLFYSSRNKGPHLLIEDDSFDIETIRTYKSRHTNSILVLRKLSSTNDFFLTIFQKENQYSNFIEIEIPVSEEHLVNRSSLPSRWGMELFEGQTNFAILYVATWKDTIDDSCEIILIDLNKKTVISSNKIEGIQRISISPNGHEVAVLGKKLTLLSIPNLKKVEKEINLTMVRDKSSINYDRLPVSYSSCGKYLAFSYAVNGEIEILDTKTFKTIATLDSYGIPMADMSWDITGKFLACRFRSRESNKFLLVVWDMKSKKEILKIESTETNFDLPAFKWSPKDTSIATLVKKKRIQVFKLYEQ